MKFQHSFALSFNGANIKIQVNTVLKIGFLKNFYKESSIRSLQQCNTFTNLHQIIQFFFFTIFSFQLIHSILDFMVNYGTILELH